MKKMKEHTLLAFLTSYLQDNFAGITRKTELVRRCYWVMTDAYVVAYDEYSKRNPRSWRQTTVRLCFDMILKMS